MNNQELTIGEIRAMYFDNDALRIPEMTMYRMDIRGGRNYFTIPLTEEGEEPDPVFFTGVTTLTSRMIPKEEALVKWMCGMGYDNAIAYRDERAYYGTLMHTIFAEFLINGKVDLNLLDSVVGNYIIAHQLWHVDLPEWVAHQKQDLLAFAQFCIDYDVKPLAIEVTLGDPVRKVAGTVDLVCKMTIEEKGYFGEFYKSGPRKGEPKETKRKREVLAIVDFKSGRKSHGGKHNAAQLYFYKSLVHFTWPDLEIERVYNWNPKDWRTTPGYTLTDQTEKYTDKQARHLYRLFKLENKDPEENKRVTMQGEIVLGGDPQECFSVKTIEELASDMIAERDGDIQLWQYDEFDSFVDSSNPNI